MKIFINLLPLFYVLFFYYPIPSLTPIVVESRCYCTFEFLAMNSVSYKFLFF